MNYVYYAFRSPSLKLCFEYIEREELVSQFDCILIESAESFPANLIRVDECYLLILVNSFLFKADYVYQNDYS